MAVSSVRQLHQSARQRIEYKEQCRIAKERGQPMPEPPPKSKVDQLMESTIGKIQETVRNPEEAGKQVGALWKKAQAGIKRVSAIAMEHSHGNPNNIPNAAEGASRRTSYGNFR